ncbi:hypothetical protein, partial [Staphylococcus aureus]|uniref:hypothetical protein n=1 Tax=Staphylococcus aureus TaxID=1280 RepID=UPI001A90D9FE
IATTSLTLNILISQNIFTIKICHQLLKVFPHHAKYQNVSKIRISLYNHTTSSFKILLLSFSIFISYLSVHT